MFKSKANKADKAAKQQPVFKQDYFINCHRTYSCIHCRAHLANHDELISKLFQGNHGRAYLFNKVVNIGCKQAVQRELLTGLHAVADIYCDNCETTLGWKYEQAFAPSQKYKEGKYIIELVHMLKENDWDLTSYNTSELLEESKRESRQKSKMANSFRIGSTFVANSASKYDFNSTRDDKDDKTNGNNRNMIERRALSLDLSHTSEPTATPNNTTQNPITNNLRRLTNVDDQLVAAIANQQQQQQQQQQHSINHGDESAADTDMYQLKQNPPSSLSQNSEISNKQQNYSNNLDGARVEVAEE